MPRDERPLRDLREACRSALTGRPMPSRWFLYLIECRDGSIYTGITVDVAARYAAHAAGKGARYTRSHPPQALLAVFEYADRSAASKAECEVKRLPPAAKRALGARASAASPNPGERPPCRPT